jgi:hypothetical protein
MVRYKMIARDLNSNPTQHRQWIVANNPDLQAQFYYGSKSGTNAFVDVSAYAINDPAIIAGFNLPLPTMWNPSPGELITDFPIRKVLPAPIEDSQLAVIDGYIYLFGSKVSADIYMASIDNPADWTNTGAMLPTPLYGASLAIVGNNIYLFGGNDGYASVSTIFSAPVSNPLNWTNHGSLLPAALQYSSLGMYNGFLYLFGGQINTSASSAIFTAPSSNPLAWTNTGHNLPLSIYGASIAQIDGYWMMYGGNTLANMPTNNIISASINSPTSWELDGYLPYSTAFSQFVTVGNDGYLIGPMAGSSPTGFTSIIRCHLNNPNAFWDTQKVVRGVVSHSQLAIIYDRVFIFGGSGESAIFASNQQLKYNFYNGIVQEYANITRVVLPATDNLDNPFQALSTPYWLTDYSLSPPLPAPPVPPPPTVFPPFPSITSQPPPYI